MTLYASSLVKFIIYKIGKICVWFMPLLNGGSCCHCTAENVLVSHHNLGFILHSITRLFLSKSYFPQKSSFTFNVSPFLLQFHLFSYFFLCLHFVIPTPFNLLLSVMFLPLLLLFSFLLFSPSL